MTVEEVFTAIGTHMLEGIMMHEQISRAYDFLNMKGYKECHYYHYLSENKNYHCLLHYYMDHYHKLLNIVEAPDPKIIPQSWYKYGQPEVDVNTKRNSVKELMQKWVAWEKETKTLLQKSYKDLYEIGEISAMKKITYFLCDVDQELRHAESKWMNLESTGYDINHIMSKQEKLYKKYKEKIECLFKKD